jgi:hypothetical protein
MRRPQAAASVTSTAELFKKYIKIFDQFRDIESLTIFFFLFFIFHENDKKNRPNKQTNKQNTATFYSSVKNS